MWKFCSKSEHTAQYMKFESQIFQQECLEKFERRDE